MKKILLIGDSIRKGYDKYVRSAFEGIAEVYYPDDNCRFASYILRHIADWKDELGCGDDVDLVHWNAGLWDDLVLLDGKNHTPIEAYRENVGRVCDIIEILFPKAKMIFATSTPVLEKGFGAYHFKRYNRDTEMYNSAASEIVLQHGGIINDLYDKLDGTPSEYHSDQTHYYTKEGTRLITDQVTACIEKFLNIKAKPLDYDALFADDTLPLG